MLFWQSKHVSATWSTLCNKAKIPTGAFKRALNVTKIAYLRICGKLTQFTLGGNVFLIQSILYSKPNSEPDTIPSKFFFVEKVDFYWQNNEPIPN